MTAPVARIGRWMGAVVVDVDGEQRLVGTPKEPCRFVPPVPLASPLAIDPRPIDELAALVTARLVIARNGSVSERLWRLVCQGGPRAQWLVDVPGDIWELVRDAVLRCS